MLKKNIIAKILLSSFMLPSLMNNAVPVFAAPGDPNEQSVSDSKQVFADQQVSDTESESSDQSSDSKLVGEIPSPTATTNSPEQSHHSVPTLIARRQMPVLNTTNPISNGKIENSLKMKNYISNHLKDGVLDLSELSIHEIRNNTSYILSVVENLAHLEEIHTIKFSYKHLYAIASKQILLNNMYTVKRSNWFMRLIGKVAIDEGEYSDFIFGNYDPDMTYDFSNIDISFDYMLPFAPHPFIPNKVIDMRSIYNEFKNGFNSKVKFDSVIVYTNPKFTIFDWLMEVYPLIEMPHPFDPFYKLNKTDSNIKNKVNHVVICGEPNMKTLSEDILNIRNTFKNYYDCIPTIEFNNSLNPISNVSSDSGKRILEPVYLCNVLSYLQNLDDPKLTLQQNFNSVSKNANEAVGMLKTTDPNKFIHHDLKTVRKLVPNIESFTLTEDTLISLYRNPSQVKELNGKLLSNKNIKRVVIDIKPRRLYCGNRFSFQIYNDIDPNWIKELLLGLKRKDLKIEIKSLAIDPTIKIENAVSSAFLDFAKDNGISIKFLYIHGELPPDFNILEFIRKYSSVINDHTVIVLDEFLDENLRAIVNTFPRIKVINSRELFSYENISYIYDNI